MAANISAYTVVRMERRNKILNVNVRMAQDKPVS